MVMPSGFFGQPQHPFPPRRAGSPFSGGFGDFGALHHNPLNPSTPPPPTPPPPPAFDFLEEEPRLAYYGQQGRFGRSPNQRRYFQDAFQNIFNQYLGQLGQQIQGGGQPNLQFTDFIRDFDFNQSFANLDPGERGFFPSRIAPRTRFLFY